MRIPIAAIAGAVAAFVAAGMLGVAAAEAPAPAPVRSVSVQGVATVPVPQGADAANATAAYRAAMAAALADGQSKAAFLAGKAGATLGAVQTIVEGGGYISCTSGDNSTYVEYQGEAPDFGSPGGAVTPLRANGVAAPVASGPAPRLGKPSAKHPRRRKKPTAKHASATSCSLSTQVAVAYALS